MITATPFKRWISWPIACRARRVTIRRTTDRPRRPQNAHRKFWLRWAHVVGSASFIVILAASGAPISLYTTYRAVDGFSDTDLAVVTLAYLSAVVLTLLVFGRLSDYLGRRIVGMVALVIAVAGCVVLVGVHHPGQLLGARVLQGIACGLAPSCLGAYVAETAPPNRRWMAALITGSGPMIGISMGAVGTGALVEYAAHPRQLAYLLIAGVLVVCTGLFALCPETVRRPVDAVGSLRPRLRVPPRAARIVATACLACLATWPIGGFYQAFAPSVATQYLGAGNALVTAVVFASVLVLNPVAGPIVGRRPSTTWIQLAMVLFVLSVAGLVATLHWGLVWGFIGAGLLIGLAQGLASTSAMGLLLPATTATERAGVLATVYVVSYFSTTISVAAAGGLTAAIGLDQILVGYAIVCVAAALATVISAAHQKRGATDAP